MSKEKLTDDEIKAKAYLVVKRVKLEKDLEFYKRMNAYISDWIRNRNLYYNNDTDAGDLDYEVEQTVDKLEDSLRLLDKQGGTSNGND